jgi:hypothetical protein
MTMEDLSGMRQKSLKPAWYDARGFVQVHCEMLLFLALATPEGSCVNGQCRQVVGHSQDARVA